MSKKKPARTRKPKVGESVACGECGRSYLLSELVKRAWSSAGMKRPGGGPNGSWREVWKCCPQGHRVIRVSFRIS